MEFPLEVWHQYILPFLSAKELASCALVNHSWNKNFDSVSHPVWHVFISTVVQKLGSTCSFGLRRQCLSSTTTKSRAIYSLLCAKLTLQEQQKVLEKERESLKKNYKITFEVYKADLQIIQQLEKDLERMTPYKALYSTELTNLQAANLVLKENQTALLKLEAEIKETDSQLLCSENGLQTENDGLISCARIHLHYLYELDEYLQSLKFGATKASKVAEIKLAVESKLKYRDVVDYGPGRPACMIHFNDPKIMQEERRELIAQDIKCAEIEKILQDIDWIRILKDEVNNLKDDVDRKKKKKCWNGGMLLTI